MFRGLVRELYWDSDAAAPLVLAERLRGHGPVYISHYGSWTTLWGLLATRDVPGHARLWEVSGYAFALATAALVGWATGRVAGRWAGATAAAASLVVGPAALRALLTLNFHVAAPFAAAVLAAYVVVLSRRPSLVLAAAVGVFGGATAASDPLVWIAAIAPFAAAAAVFAAMTRRADVVARAAVVLSVAASIALSTNVVMRGVGFHVVGVEARLAHADELWTNLVNLGRLVALVGGANYALPGGYPHEPLRVFVALAVLGGAAAAVIAPVRLRAQRAEPLLVAYTAFWAVAIVLLAASLVVTNRGTYVGAGGFLYLLTAAPAVAAGTAVLASSSRRGRIVVGLAVALVAVTNVAGLVEGRAGTPKGAVGTYAEPLLRVLQREGATRGYAGYWDAQSLTWQSGMRVHVVPVSSCGRSGERLCPFRFGTISSWFEEQAGRSFLIVDPQTGFVTEPPGVVRDASAVHRLGPLTVYVFPYDLARHIR